MLTLNQYTELTIQQIDKIAEESVCYFAWKDKQSHYLGGNQTIPEFTQIPSIQEILGLTDFDLNWLNGGHTAEYFTAIDKQVMAGRPLTNAKEIVLKANPYGEIITRIILISKRPIVHNGRCIGVAYEAIDVTSSILSAPILYPSANDSSIVKNFTTRELVCIKFLLCGYSYQQIGDKLNLSSRTIEYHFDKIRDKLNCRNKSALIEKLIKMGFKAY